jgi:hypothetical protein
MYVTVFNGGDSPVLISDDGRSVGGGDWATALSTDDAVKSALASGAVVKIDAPEGSDQQLNPAAKTVLDQTAAYTDRAEKVKDWDKAALEEFATEKGLVAEGVDENLTVTQLRRRVTESSHDLPSAAASKRTAKADDESSTK